MLSLIGTRLTIDATFAEFNVGMVTAGIFVPTWGG